MFGYIYLLKTREYQDISLGIQAHPKFYRSQYDVLKICDKLDWEDAIKANDNDDDKA
jgi:hypothetical protein